MNDRIHKLAEQAGFDLYEDGNFRSDPGQWINAEIEKFAELIVQECAVLCRWEHEAHAMLEHFGVKP